MRIDEVFRAAARLQNSGQLEESKRLYKRILAKEPNRPEVLNNLGLALIETGDMAGGEKLLQRATSVAPRNIDLLSAYLKFVYEQKRYKDVEFLARRILDIENDNFNALNHLGIALSKLGRFEAAQLCFGSALEKRPNDRDILLNLANCQWQSRSAPADALENCLALIEMDPGNHQALAIAGMIYVSSGRIFRGIEFLQLAAQFQEDNVYLNNIANAYIYLGDVDNAIEYGVKASSLDPTAHLIRGNLLFALNYDYKLSAEEIFKEYQDYNATQKAVNPGFYDHSGRDPVGADRIRIGFSSADFRRHAVSFFIEPLLKNIDRSRFELFAYANIHNPDEFTTRFRGYFDHWIDTFSLDDEAMAERINEDGIDILMDLAGHSTGNRLPVFAMKPAPVQVSYLGYGYTTGLTDIDYFLGDENFTPEGFDHLFSEEVVRLDGPVYCYNPSPFAPPVEASPAKRNGYVTFGTMSRVIRFNDPMLLVWKQILERVPNARLRFDQTTFGEPEAHDYYIERLTKLGFPMDRVAFVESLPHWNGYHEIDITLDCWPHNIGTTAAESMWMGAPVLTKRDRVSVGRVASSMIMPVGLNEWIVDTEAEFVERAVALASDIDALAKLRAELRDRMLKSPLMDGPAFATRFEQAFIGMVKRLDASLPKRASAA